LTYFSLTIVAIKELKEILQDHDVSVEERKSIEESIQDLQAGKLKELRDRVKTLPIVGATFAATCFPVLNDCSFDVVVMDEATQSLEPMCLVPFIRFKPSHTVRLCAICHHVFFLFTLKSYAMNVLLTSWAGLSIAFLCFGYEHADSCWGSLSTLSNPFNSKQRPVSSLAFASNV
jgi:hypothetical protein